MDREENENVVATHFLEGEGGGRALEVDSTPPKTVGVFFLFRSRSPGGKKRSTRKKNYMDDGKDYEIESFMGGGGERISWKRSYMK